MYYIILTLQDRVTQADFSDSHHSTMLLAHLSLKSQYSHTQPWLILE